MTKQNSHHGRKATNSQYSLVFFNSIRKLFKITSLDIFDVHFRYGYGIYIILSLWLISLCLDVNTILDVDHFDLVIRIKCLAFLFGPIQVSKEYLMEFRLFCSIGFQRN